MDNDISNDEQITLDSMQHSAHAQRNLNSPFNTGSTLDSAALGVQNLGDVQLVVKRDAMRRPIEPIRKAELDVSMRMKI